MRRRRAGHAGAAGDPLHATGRTVTTARFRLELRPGEAMPDVFQAGNTWLPELAALDALEPLDDRIARSPAFVRGDYFPGILDTNVIDGVTWGLPWYVDTRVPFYRTDLLAEAGYPEPPRTWTAWTGRRGRMAGVEGLLPSGASCRSPS